MLDWTTRDYLTFARLFNPYIHLYTEMIGTSAILHNAKHKLWFYQNQHPLVLQLGGSNPQELALCTKMAQQFGYDEINLNVGCPSDRVQHHKIGACLMAEPQLVAQCIQAMQDAVDIPITIKHRIGIDHHDSYEFMHDFVATIVKAGCRHVIVHARTAWLKGLSPKENREIPPLRYHDVYRLKQDFPHVFVEINGGITNLEQTVEHLKHVDGVMIGRQAYHNPFILGQMMALWGEKTPTHREIFDKLLLILQEMQNNGIALTMVMRHYLGLFQGMTGARLWRQTLSGQKHLTLTQIEQAGNQVLNSIQQNSTQLSS